MVGAIFILLAVGALIGTWNLSGTIPTLVYYGMHMLSPAIFYVASAVICGVVALSIGSSWTTAATVGVGLVGIAIVLGVSPAITAGAVISGGKDTAAAKMEAMAAAGIHVADSPAALGSTMVRALKG